MTSTDPKTKERDVRGAKSVLIAKLNVLDILHDLAAIASDAEPTVEELKRELAAGRQPYPLIVSGDTVIFGFRLLAVARALSIQALDAEECTGFEGLSHDDRNLRAISYFLAAVKQRRPPDSFRLRLLAAEVYQAWVLNSKHRAPRHTTMEVQKQREQDRAQLIQQTFGRSQRGLQRDVKLLTFPRELLDAARAQLIPDIAIEAVAKLSPAEQKKLANRLADGVPFADAASGLVGIQTGRRKTDRAAFEFVRGSIHAVVAELEGREVGFKLLREDYTNAIRLRDMLATWLRVPPPSGSAESNLADIANELNALRGAEQVGGGLDATSGGGRVKGGEA